MRSVLSLLVLTGLAACASDGPATIKGSARLPDCSDAPALDASGIWFDEGQLTIQSEGCEELGAPLGTVHSSCPLNWQLEQNGNDVELIVDQEYALRGRICGDTLHLEGGWWLPLQDEQGQCNYDDDDGDEVGIEMGGSSLHLQPDDGRGEHFAGTLSLRGPCTGSYDMTLRPVPFAAR